MQGFIFLATTSRLDVNFDKVAREIYVKGSVSWCMLEECVKNNY